MTRLAAVLDAVNVIDLLAVLALLGLGSGVALVFSAGWALIVVSGLLLVYALAASRSEPAS